MIGHGLSMAVAARLERCADQDVIEAQRGGMFELRGPLRQWSDEKRVDEIDSGCIRLKQLMVFHRSSFPVRPAMAWMRENAIALNQAINQPQERLRQTSLRQSSKHQFRGDECGAHRHLTIRRSLRRQGRRGDTARSVPRPRRVSRRVSEPELAQVFATSMRFRSDDIRSWCIAIQKATSGQPCNRTIERRSVERQALRATNCACCASRRSASATATAGTARTLTGTRRVRSGALAGRASVRPAYSWTYFATAWFQP